MGHQKSNARRQFLRHATALLAGGGASAVFPQMSMIRAASAQQTGDYKALVCLELNGGADNFNLLAPRDSQSSGSHFDNYRQARGGVFQLVANEGGRALAFEDLMPITGRADPSNNVTVGDYGVHPECLDRPFTNDDGLSGDGLGIASLYENADLAFVANVGPLVTPITKTEFEQGIVPRPPAIGGHDRQRRLWRNGRTDLRWNQGWGGMIAAQLAGVPNGVIPLSPSISLAGNNLFGTARYLADGRPLQPYVMTAGGAEKLGVSIPQRTAVEEILALTYPELILSEAQKTVSNARMINDQLNTALRTDSAVISTPYQTSSGFDPVNGRYPAARIQLPSEDSGLDPNPLLDQFRQVAQMIKLSRDQASGIDASRQVYYLSLPGYDTHSRQMVKPQPDLTAMLSQALGYFSQAMKDIGAENDVTTFTISEFGRTLSPNLGGTDHAWGSHHLIMGGAVRGGKIYGQYPDAILNADSNANQDWSFARGEYIPTTSVDQMGATLGKWMGLGANELAAVFPNLGNFVPDLGFMESA